MMVNPSISRRLITMLVLAFCLQAQAVQGQIVSTEDLATQSSIEQDRARIKNFLERSDVKQKLQTMGVNGMLAEERVASLDQQEVHTLAQQIDSLPAGGNLSNMDMVIILLIAILVVVAI